MALPTDAQERKNAPIYSGVLKYFPDAIAAVAQLSKIGNDQHNPGQPLHWAREKSADHHDCLIRHAMDAGTIDTDGVLHSAKVAWRALAALQLELEAAQGVQDKLDDDGWIVADPNCPPDCGYADVRWNDGEIWPREKWDSEDINGEWAIKCDGSTRYITHWRPVQDKPDDDGWVAADPECPPDVKHDLLWNDGDVHSGCDPEDDAGWWEFLCRTEDLGYATHWRPSKES